MDSSGLDWKRSSATQTAITLDWVGKGHLKTNVTFSIVPPVGKERVEHKMYMEQPPTVVGVTSKSPGQLDWKRSLATQTTIALDWVGKGRPKIYVTL